MNKKILVLGVVVFLNFSGFFVLANNNIKSDFEGGSIGGYVRQVNGNPIVGAYVEVIQPGVSGWSGVNTGSDGSYRIDGLSTGDYMIRAYKSGYAREYFDNVFSSTDATIIHVNESEEVSDVDFTLTLGGSISGKIYQIDAVTPIEGAYVFVCPSRYRFDEGFWGQTDSDGAYSVENLYLGNFKVTAIAEGYAGLVKYYNNVLGWDNGWDILVEPPYNTPGIDICLERSGSISGFVFASDGKTPIPNVSLFADITTGEFNQGFNGVSNDDGSYIIKDIFPGIYSIRTETAHIPGWYASEFYDSKNSWETRDSVKVNEGSNTPNINFTLDEGGSITGHVFDEKTREILGNIQLVALIPNGECTAPVGTTIFDPVFNGSYKFILKPGDYFIKTGSGPDSLLGFKYVPEWYDNASDMSTATLVTVTLHKDTSDIDVYLAESGSISGTIYNEEGGPISDASIYAFSNIYPGSSALSGEDGSYKIEALPSGDYMIQVTISGFNSEYYNNVSDPADATLVTVDAPDETKNVDFFLSKGIGVYISRPEIGTIYLFDKEIVTLPFNFPIIIGKINMKAVAFGADKVDFYLDDELKYTDNESPFNWYWDEISFGKHTLKVVVYEVVDVISNEINVLKFF